MSESAVRAYAAARHFAPATVERWLRHDRGGRDALLAVAERLRLGENQLRDVLDQVEDIAARRGAGIACVLAEQPIVAVFERKLGRNETIRALRGALRRLRFPQLSHAEAELSRLVREMRLPSRVTFEFPEGLEGDRISVRLNASSAVELRALAGALEHAVQLEQIDRMYAILEGKE